MNVAVQHEVQNQDKTHQRLSLKLRASMNQRLLRSIGRFRPRQFVTRADMPVQRVAGTGRVRSLVALFVRRRSHPGFADVIPLLFWAIALPPLWLFVSDWDLLSVDE